MSRNSTRSRSVPGSHGQWRQGSAAREAAEALESGYMDDVAPERSAHWWHWQEQNSHLTLKLLRERRESNFVWLARLGDGCVQARVRQRFPYFFCLLFLPQHRGQGNNCIRGRCCNNRELMVGVTEESKRKSRCCCGQLCDAIFCLVCGKAAHAPWSYGEQEKRTLVLPCGQGWLVAKVFCHSLNENGLFQLKMSKWQPWFCIYSPSPASVGLWITTPCSVQV